MSDNSAVMGAKSPLPGEVLTGENKSYRMGVFLRKFSKQKMPLVVAFFIILLFLIAIFRPFLTPYNPDEPNYDALMAGPSAAHYRDRRIYS